nr:HAMP domain-containing sensor histidine kinase [Aquabacterium terrae]
MALHDARGQRIGASESYLRREAEGAMPATPVALDDGRTLWIARRPLRRAFQGEGPRALGGPAGPPRPGWAEGPRGPFGAVPGGGPGGAGAGPGGPGGGPGAWRERAPAPRDDDAAAPGAGGLRLPSTLLLPGEGLPAAIGPVVLVVLLLLAVAAGAYPVVRRLTRRLETLKQGVEAFGAGRLAQRVDDSGSDEVAAVANTFNRAAERIETLVRSHQNLLANASHELRSPLARLKMAVALYTDAAEPQRPALRKEIETNVAELDALVEEVLLASRLDTAEAIERSEPVELLGLAAEEAARVGAQAAGAAVTVRGSERLLRRALRNLLENARRYGGAEVEAEIFRRPDGGAEARVSDRGPGVPAAYRERIFEPFFRLPGHAEREGGVGLGLSLVRQIAEHHGGSVRCEPREGGGSCFVLALPAV